MNQDQIARLTLAAYASEIHKDIFKCGCEIPNGCNYDYDFNFVCDSCYEAAQAGKPEKSNGAS